jgi:tripartite-type tricarboxylate transporter receptor subunit TctC
MRFEFALRRNKERDNDMRRNSPSLVVLCKGIVVATVAAFCASTLAAESYPIKPVRIIVAAGPGGGDDFVSRVIAAKLGESLGQQFIVDNRPGAGGFIGQSFVLKSPPDGYTLLLAGGSMAGARFANAAVTYDVLRDFTPLSLVETSPFVLVVHSAVPARNLKEYMALARSRPGKMTFASIGAGQIPYWSVMLFNSTARINAVEIQYKAIGEALVGVMSGEVDYTFTASVGAVTNKAKLRALGVTTTKRSAMLPDVPTLEEAGLPGYAMPAWRSIMGPAGMSRELVASLNAAIGQALAAPDVRERFLKAGSEPTASSPEELRKKYAEWIVIFGKIAKEAGLKPQ